VPLESYLEQELQALEEQGLLRARPVPRPAEESLVDICTNDYLGYARRDVSRETVGPAGAGASRLVHGSHRHHYELERELADWCGTEDALVFASSFAANVGLVSALARPGDLIVSDQHNHASVVDGCRLSRARVVVVPHCDAEAVARALQEPAARRRWVVSESYFSMDGDSPDLVKLRALADAGDASLIVDEAHALGVFGPEGSGVCRARGVRPDALVGGLGKGLGVQGGFVAGSRSLIHYLANRARPFVFSTGISPCLAAVALDHVRAVRRDDDARQRLRSRCTLFSSLLEEHALARGVSGPIYPIILGSPDRALRAVARLAAEGYLAQAIRPPTVPAQTSRLRIAVHADHTNAQLEKLASVLSSICRES
jgi:8-amino-7-oxononanoate synthase